MDVKTIKELNIKVWYRLLKVIWFISFFAFLIVGVLWGYRAGESVGYLDHDRSTIICNYGNNNKFTFTSTNYVFNYTEVGTNDLSYVADYKKQGIYELCEISDLDVFGIDPLFTFNPIISTHRGVLIQVLYVGLIVCVLIVIFEAIRRTFYYIILGKIFPEKR